MNGDIQQDSLLLNRPFSSTGLPGGSLNINGNGSVTPIDYYIEALAGERLSVARLIIHLVDGGSIDSGAYGNGITLANGIQLLYRRSGNSLNITNGLPIKTNPDWGRWCYDVAISTYGAGNQTLNSRWTLTKYGNPWGIILEEGDRLGIRLNDDLSGLIEQTIVAEGVHLGTPSPLWTELLVPPST